MKITICAWRDAHYLSLENILDALVDYCHSYRWTLNVIDAAPEPGAQALIEHDLNQSLSYDELLKLVSPELQIIDGEAVAFERDSSNEKLMIRAIDSTSWDIETEEEIIFERIKARFPWATHLD